MKKTVNKALEIVGVVLYIIAGLLVFIFSFCVELELLRFSEIAEIEGHMWAAGILTDIALLFTVPCIMGVYFALTNIVFKKLLFAEEKPSE